ncbi:WG repeat-containing protein [Dysgonomonas sp. 216]|uniref:WG repeat-containing protein n=1 Tax=Dysgonomonas sp. 216 TaxID=2302934 RepID=UPI0013D59A69|nr:WG repeat-containing protein [Dysgonomonas sp. 216]NDW18198.1 WG repeat-containing protein [Dysgonomonas sp. 216]
MKRNIILVITSLLVLSLHAQTTVVFEKNEKFGLKVNDKVVLKPSFDYMHPLKDGFFLAEKDKKIGVVSKNGKTILPIEYEDIQLFGDDHFKVMKNGLWGVVNVFNGVLLPAEHSSLKQLTSFLWETVGINGKRGLFSKFGQTVSSVSDCDEIIPITDNLLLVRSGRKMGVIDDMGNTLIPAYFEKLEQLPFDNLYKVVREGKIGVMDISGHTIAEPLYDELDCSNKRYMVLKRAGKLGFIINNKCIPADYDKIVFAQDDLGVIAVKKGNLNGFVTIYGLVIPPIYDNISRFSPRGHAFVEKRGKLMFVDLNGKEHTLQEVGGNGARR